MERLASSGRGYPQPVCRSVGVHDSAGSDAISANERCLTDGFQFAKQICTRAIPNVQ